SESPRTPTAPEAPQLTTGVSQTVLTSLSYSGSEIDGSATFAFQLPEGLRGRFGDVLAPAAGQEPCWFQFGVEPQWLGIIEPQWDQDHEPQWVRGSGLIHSLPAAGGQVTVAGQGTIAVPVTGTRTEGGVTTSVTGTLVIVLERDVVQPKLGAPYFEVCGVECLRFRLQAFFFPAAGDFEPCWIDGLLLAVDPQ
ncbi:MAG TPA: hypothetical protein VFZ26_01630, partial [Gemmatimonadales bacterium]